MVLEHIKYRMLKYFQLLFVNTVLWTSTTFLHKHCTIMNAWIGLRGLLEMQRPSGFHLLYRKPALFMGFSSLYYIHYLQGLLGVDSFNCLHWNNGPCKTEHEQNLWFTAHLSRLKVSPSQICVTAHLPWLFSGRWKWESQSQEWQGNGAGKSTPSNPRKL